VDYKTGFSSRAWQVPCSISRFLYVEKRLAEERERRFEICLSNMG
jgi:hypothetical protein